MKENVGKLSLALLLLVGVWITVYTVWQPDEPPITFGENPTHEPAIPPVPEEPAAGPEQVEQTVEAVPVPIPEAPPAKSSPAVVPPQFAQYTVRKGDTLQSISRQFYGTAAHAGAIGRANPFMDPSKLRPGRVIRVPRDPGNIQGRPRAGELGATLPPASRSLRKHVIQPGDTLSGISQEFYGSPAHAARIFEANKDKLKGPDDLRVGVELVIPEIENSGKKEPTTGGR